MQRTGDGRRGPRRFRREIPADLSELRRARRWLAGCLRDLGAEANAAGPDLELVLGEILTNAIRHAYGPGGQGVIEMEVGLHDGDVTLAVRDYGRAMDPALYSPPDLDVPQEGGYGIFLIQKLTDELRIESPDGIGNLLTVRRRVRGPAAEPAGERG